MFWSGLVFTVRHKFEMMDPYICTLLLFRSNGALVKCCRTTSSESSEVDTYCVAHVRWISFKNLGDVIFEEQWEYLRKVIY